MPRMEKLSDCAWMEQLTQLPTLNWKRPARAIRNLPGKVILVDMAGVVFMNNEVASKLAGLRSEQLRIINCSPFIETLLNTVERDQKNQQ